MKQTLSFTEGAVSRQLYLMTVPMVWGLLATMSFNAADTFFVAQLGAAPLAAMSFTFPVVMAVTSLAIGLGAGISSVIARTIGQGKADDARRMASDTLVLAGLIAVLLMLLGWLSVDWLFLLMGASRELLPLIREYMLVWYLNVPLLLIPMAMSALLRSTGNSGINGTLMVFSALLNIALDPLLIFGLWGFPRLDIAGAAWATFVCRLIVMPIFFYWVSIKLDLLAKPSVSLHRVLQSWRAILHVGLPAMATNMIIPFASGLTVSLVAKHGIDAVAGYGVAMRIEPLMLVIFYAISGVVGPFLGQNMAPELQHRQQELRRVILKFCLWLGLCLAVFLYVFAAPIIAWFSDSPVVMQVALSYLLIVPISYGIYGVVMSVNAGFNGLGMPMPSMVISTSRVLLVYFPMALMMQSFWGIKGLFIATALSNVVVGVWGYWWFKRALNASHKHHRSVQD